jgi:hypothetical protein
MPLLCTKLPRNISNLAMSSPGAGRRRSGQIPANRRPGPAGRGRWMDLGPLGVDFRARLGAGRHRRARPAQPRGGGCWNGGCGGLAAKARRPAAWGVKVGVCASANDLRNAGGSSRTLGAGTTMAAGTAARPRSDAGVPVLQTRARESLGG